MIRSNYTVLLQFFGFTIVEAALKYEIYMQVCGMGLVLQLSVSLNAHVLFKGQTAAVIIMR